MGKPVKTPSGKVIYLKTNFETIDKHEVIYTTGKVLFTQDEKFMITTNHEDIKVTDLETGRVVHTLKGDSELITCISLSPDDEKLIVASRSLVIRIWDWKTETVTNSLKSNDGPISALVWDSTSTLLAMGASSGAIKVWDMNKLFITHSFRGSNGIISTLSFFANSNELSLVSAAAFDKKIRIWNLMTKKQVHELEGHMSVIRSIAFSHCKNYMISGARDNTVIIWKLNEKKIKNLITIPVMESVEGLVVGPATKDNNDQYFVTAGSSGNLRTWSIPRGESLKTIPLGRELTEMTLLPKKDRIVCVNSTQDITFHTFPSLEISRHLVGYNDEIIDAKMLDETYMTVATNSEQLRIMNLETHDCASVLGHKDIILCVDVSHDGQYITTSSKDTEIRVWKVLRSDNGHIEKILCIGHGVGHTDAVDAVCFARKTNAFVISGAQDFTVKIWDTSKIHKYKSDVQLHTKSTVKAHNKDINVIDVSPNDKLFATGSHDRTVKIWDTETMKLLGTLSGHRRGIWDCKFSPVDKCIASASSDKTIKIWSLNDYTCLKTLEDHTMPVLKVVFLTHGMQLASTSSDGLIKLWNIKTSECVTTLDGHTDKVWALSATPSEKKLITGGGDSLINVWEDVSVKVEQEKLAEENELIEKENELSNLMIEGNYIQAAKLAISLNKPFTLLKLCKEIKDAEGVDIKQILQSLEISEIGKILQYVKQWNTNAKHSTAAQYVLASVLRSFKPEDLVKCDDLRNTIEGLLPYTERHLARINRLMQQSFFVDYTWQNMRIGNLPISVASMSDVTGTSSEESTLFSAKRSSEDISEEAKRLKLES